MKPVEGFQAVFVSEEPAWLCGFECGDPEIVKTERQMYSSPNRSRPSRQKSSINSRGSSSSNPICRIVGTWFTCDPNMKRQSGEMPCHENRNFGRRS